jgi:hypothetical protein
MKFQVVHQNALAIPFFLLISFVFTPYAAHAQGYEGTGMSRESLETMCKNGVQIGVLNKKPTSNYVDNMLKARYILDKSTNQEYRNQKNWFRNNCPSY